MKIKKKVKRQPEVVRSGREEINLYVEAVSAEYALGLHSIHEIGPAVTVFGSARSKPGDRVYTEAMDVGRLLANAGYSVVTGGGGGVMEAANRGAALAGGGSIGMPIVLPFERHGNEYAEVSISFDHFPARKTCLISACDAVVVFAGGFGTLDELFEVLTLIQTGKLRPMPIILVGTHYWAGLFEWLLTQSAPGRYISESDLDLVRVVDSPKWAVDALLNADPVGLT